MSGRDGRGTKCRTRGAHPKWSVVNIPHMGDTMVVKPLQTGLQIEEGLWIVLKC